MTITITQTTVTYSGNNATTVFAFPFMIPEAAELFVSITQGGVTSAVVSSLYTATGFGNATGGSITYNPSGTPLPTGATITLQRILPIEQETSLSNQGAYYPVVVESALDYLTMVCQQLQSQINGLQLIPIPQTPYPLDNIAALQALTDAFLGTLVFVAGYYGPGTPGGGPFAKLAAPTTPNGITIFNDSALMPRSWQRIYDPHNGNDVMWSGTTGNGTTDDTTAIQTAITYVESTYDPAVYTSNSPFNGSCTLGFPAGFFKIDGTLSLTKKVAFHGDGPAEFSSGTRLIQYAVNSDMFQVDPIAQGISISFENMTLRGAGSGTGNLINILNTLATCNSQRYYSMVFGTPMALALRIKAGDDIIIDRCLVDSSAANAYAFGTSTAADVTSNIRLTNSAFFAVNLLCLALFNVDGMQIIGAQVYPSGSGRTNRFIDGHNTLPYQLKNISLIGGNFKSVNCLIQADAVTNLTISGATCSTFGAGSGATLNGIELAGTCSGVSIIGNSFSGSFDTKHFYDDSGATVTGANITGNTFINTGGTGQALSCANTSGVIANNTFIGFTTPSVSEKVATTGNAVSPGTITTLSSYTKTFTVTGALQTDTVIFGPASTTWFAPIGIEVVAYISAANTVSVEYRNVTSGSIGVPAHDITYCVNR